MQVRQDGSVKIKQRLCAKGALAGVPISGAFELTPRCNFQCKMCYIRLTPEQMRTLGTERTASQWISLGKEASEAGLMFLLLTGGEPLLREDFEEIYSGLCALGLSLSLNTNGSLLRESTKKMFLRDPPSRVNITLYGANSEDYARLCGDPGGFSRTLSSLRWFRDNDILVRLNTTITPWNAKAQEAISALAAEEGLPLHATCYTFPPARRSEHSDYQRLLPEQAGILLARQDLAEGGQTRVDAIVRKIKTPSDSNPACMLDAGEPLSCYAGRGQFWITWNGQMTPCGMLAEPATLPWKDGFLTAWKELKDRTAEIRLCPDCVTCIERATCTNCAAVTSSETGQFCGKPDYMCRLNHAFREEILQISKDQQ